jgi:hypothetical protein
MMNGVILAATQLFDKTRPGEVLMGLLLAIFINIQVLFYGVVLAVLLNVISGIWKTTIEAGHLKITAKGLKRTIEKVGGYGIALAAFGLLDVLIIQITNQRFIFTVSMIISGIIILYEAKSITENLASITGLNLFKDLYEAARNAIGKRVDNDLLLKKPNKKRKTTTITEESDMQS